MIKLINVLILMAGRGNRLNEYSVPKPLIDIKGKPMIQRAIESLAIPAQYIFVKHHYDDVFWNETLDRLLEIATDFPIIYEIDEITDGPARSALVAKNAIDNDIPLIVTNCDQIMTWDAAKFVTHLEQCQDDGLVVTYGAQTTKNSYIRLDDNGYGVEIKEKEVISEHSLNGIHYWAHGKYFVESAKEMIDRNIRTNNEFYIAPTYNMLFERGMKISTYRIRDDEHWAVGTPEDINRYLEYVQ